MKFKLSLLSTALLASSFSINAANYGEALQKSILFYEAQQSGPIPEWNRLDWRGDSGMQDGADNGVDLTGGWHDAGDHAKFGFPMAAAATVLAWGVIENPEAYEKTGQMVHIKNNLRFVADYFVKAHTDTYEFYGQVGSGSVDHAWWGSAEVMQMERPSYKVTATNPGSEVTGETAAALAAISMVFADSDSDYAAELLSHARQLYDFADTYRGDYSEAIPDCTAFYDSWSSYYDELAWGAAWLYRATGESSYLSKAETAYTQLGSEGQSDYKAYKWTLGWDNKAYGTYVLMAKLTGEESYRQDAQNWLDYWTTGFNGEKITYTPGGLAFLEPWGPTRYAATTAFVALVYSDYLKSASLEPTRADTYYNFAKQQMEYILGDNPLGLSYLIGYGDYYPTKPHHRTAHGAWSNSMTEPVENRHLLIGALVGGPGDDDSWEDDRTDYIKNEVANDYNAGFVSAAARMWLDDGGSPIDEADFPTPDERDNELYIEAKVSSQSARYIEISALVHNHSAWPSRVTDALSFRYFVDLTEVFDAGYSLDDLVVSSSYSQATSLSGLTLWGDASDNIYYTEISFAGIDIMPTSESDSRKEVQFRISLPTTSSLEEWDNSNDPSWNNYSSTEHSVTDVIALYDNGSLIWGREPSPSCGADTGINCLPVAQPATASTAFATPVAITLSAADEDGSIISYELASEPANGSVSVLDDIATYSPAVDFSGSDSFTYIALDNSGASSAPATVSINVDAPIIPAVSIISPSDGEQVSVGASVTLMLDVDNAAGANVYLDGELVATRQGDGSVSVSMPTELGAVSINVVATDDSGSEIDASAAITLEVVAEVVLEPSVAILSPADGTEIIAGDDVEISISIEDAASANVYLNGELTTSLETTGTVSLTMPDTAGTTTVVVIAVDEDGQELDATASLSLSVVADDSAPGEATCTVGTPIVWNSGFVLDQLAIVNSGDSALSSWTVRIDFSEPVEIVNSWNGVFTVSSDGLSVTISNAEYNGSVAAGESTVFGMQGNYSAGFSTPSCTFIE